MNKRRVFLSTTHIIMLGFLAVVLIGSLLLALPISSKDGQAVSYTDALFTATTATCVTGLVTLPTATAWSAFGQVVILLLIQIGGLGVVTVLSGLMIFLQKKMSIGDRLLIQDSFNLNNLSGLIRFVKKVIIGTLVVEGAGALLYMTVFVPEFGLRGIWISVFNSISAFCNAGMDIIGENSLMDYAENPIINAVTCALIILGGIGYIVWWDIIRIIPSFKTKKIRAFRDLTLQSKIAVYATLGFLILGTLSFFAFEYNNPETIGEMSLFNKLQASFFQSVTTRTAGFATVSQKGLTNASCVVSLLLMFIGGSPVGTAGGIKTVTICVIIAFAVSAIKGKNDVCLFNKTLSKAAISKACAVCCMSFIILLVSTVLLCACTDADAMDIFYETVSATATVGLSRDLTPSLGLFGKIIIIITMYLGRIGPLSLAVALNSGKKRMNIIKAPVEDISVG